MEKYTDVKIVLIVVICVMVWRVISIHTQVMELMPGQYTQHDDEIRECFSIAESSNQQSDLCIQNLGYDFEWNRDIEPFFNIKCPIDRSCHKLEAFAVTMWAIDQWQKNKELK